MGNIITIQGVHGYMGADGMAQLRLEDVARGLGFTETKKGVEYVRWRTLSAYLEEFGFSAQMPKNGGTELSQQVAKDCFIPENIFYKLCFKASNETARRFQDLVTDEILPSIRKTGAYAAPGTEAASMAQAVTENVMAAVPGMIERAVASAVSSAIGAMTDRLLETAKAHDEPEKPARRRIAYHGKIDHLPVELRNKIIAMVFQENYTYLQVSDALADRDEKISQSMICRYVKRLVASAAALGDVEIE